MKKMFRIASLLVVLVLIIFCIAGTVSVLVLPPLRPWHHSQRWRDSFDYSAYRTADEFLDDEHRWIDSVYALIDQIADSGGPRYRLNTCRSPYIGGKNGNASFERVPSDGAIKGGILLVHGLTDAPYSMHAIADLFAEKGFYVFALRMPGHGTAPGALVHVRRRQWYHAVQAAARWVRARTGCNESLPFYMGGFSTGGALVLKYALENALSGGSGIPDRLFLFSPAAGVTPAAILANWHKLIAWIPVFEKFRWTRVLDENDPFKYNSFPKNAADQIHLLTRSIARDVESVEHNRGALERIPPLHSFQSPVDATVVPSALYDIYARIAPAGSSLMLFDINHALDSLLAPSHRNPIGSIDLNAISSRAQCLIVTGIRGSRDSVAYAGVYEVLPVNSGKPEWRRIPSLNAFHWPRRVFALSHTCIPIPPNDAWYGVDGILSAGADSSIWIGENGLLQGKNSPSHYHRLRWNPFFSCLRHHVNTVLRMREEPG